MILNSPYISGSLTVTGNIITSGSITISGSIASASYASNTTFLNGLGSEQFVPTGSFNTFSSSILTYTGSVNSRLGSIETVTGSNITRLSALEVTSGSNITRLGALEVASGSAITRLSALEVTSGSNITRLSALETASGSAITRLGSIETVTGSNLTRLSSLEARTGSYATTGSNTFVGGQTISGSVLQSGSFTTTGTIIAQTINVQTVTSSIVYSSGSNIFGNLLGDSQTFTGSVLVTGSIGIGTSSPSSPLNVVLGSASNGNVGAWGNGQVLIASTSGNTAAGLGFSISGSQNYISSLQPGNSWMPLNILSQGINFYANNGISNAAVLSISAAGAATFNSTITGTTIYGSTAVCSPVGKFTSCIDAGAATFACSVQANSIKLNTSTSNGYFHIETSLPWGTKSNDLVNFTGYGYEGNIYTEHNYGSINWFSGAVKGASITAWRNLPADGDLFDIAFSTNPGGVCVYERMRIKSGGNVGIGASSPCGKLQVVLPAYTNEDTDSQQAIFGSCTNGYGVRIGYNESCNAGYINSLKPGVAWSKLSLQGSSIVFAPTATERVRVTSDGLTFNGDTAAANALDDYEEGTFTPALTIGGSSAGITYTTRNGSYTKIGRLVTIQLGVKMSSIGSNTGELGITGIPFAFISDSYYHPYGVVGVVLNATLLPLYSLGAASSIVFRKANTVSDVAPTNSDIDDDTYIFVTMTYSTS